MKDYISIGITGGIGSGKSYICRIVEAMGYPVFYSDQEAKALISSDAEAMDKLTQLFGQEAYIDGQLNRAYLAEQIFSNPDKRFKMNDIVHPLVRKRFENWCNEKESTLVFNEAAILFETGSYKNFDKTILVTAPEHIKMSRIQQRDQIPEEAIKERMAAQWPDDKKIALADYVINNDESSELLPQIVNIIEKLNEHSNL